MINKLYVEHAAGGGLHIVTDDWNLDDNDVAYCLQWMKERHVPEIDIQWQCAIALESATIDERASALYKSEF